MPLRSGRPSFGALTPASSLEDIDGDAPQTMMILVTGGDGQLGLELQRLRSTGLRIVAPSRQELDIADPASSARVIAGERWSAVINAAAYTAVDRAEREVAEAWRSNALGPAVLAAETVKAGLPMLHVSTDYVFAGDKAGPYDEDDPVGPLGVYGASKLAGEIAVRTGNPRHAIVRTAWVFSAHRTNFVRTILRLAAEQPVVRVVDDQHGCPTSAADLAAALATIAIRLAHEVPGPVGTYHFVNAGATTWCGLAREVVSGSRARGGASAEIAPITTADYPTPARRPANSGLSTARLQRAFGVTPRPWQAALGDVLDELLPSSRPGPVATAR